MTEIFTGTVVHFIINPLNPAGPPILDPNPNATKPITVTLADGSNDSVAESAIVSKYVKEIPDAAAGATLDQDRQQMLIDASKGWVRVLDLRRTRIPMP